MSQKTKALYGCVLKVRNLSQLKIFYRNTLGLGEPVVDSNFWVEFSLPGNGILALEHSSTVPQQKDHQFPSCLIAVDDLKEKTEELEKNEVKVVHSDLEIPGREVATVLDPENNQITFYSIAD